MKRSRHLSGSRILTNGTISPRLSSASPQPPGGAGGPLSSPSSSSIGGSSYLLGGGAHHHHGGTASPRGITPTLPAIREAPHHHAAPHLGVGAGNKMPLNGKVPGYRQPTEIWIENSRSVIKLHICHPGKPKPSRFTSLGLEL